MNQTWAAVLPSGHSKESPHEIAMPQYLKLHRISRPRRPLIFFFSVWTALCGVFIKIFQMPFRFFFGGFFDRSCM